MNEDRLKSLFPRGSRSFFDANAGLRPEKSEPDSGAALVRETPGETQMHEKPRLSIIMHRVKLLDPDNAYGATKVLIDRLREIGVIVDDSLKDIDLSVTQEKVKHYNQQKTVVHIQYPNEPV